MMMGSGESYLQEAAAERLRGSRQGTMATTVGGEPTIALGPPEVTWPRSVPGTLWERIFTPNTVYLVWQVVGS